MIGMNSSSTMRNASRRLSRKKALAALALLSALLFGGAGLAWSVGSFSQWYAVAFDACTAAAGGASASANYRQTDSAIGQEALGGLASGPTLQEYGGVVQNWPASQNGVQNWTRYDAQ